MQHNRSHRAIENTGEVDMIHHRITPAIALTLALAASAPSAAWGDPQPLAHAEPAIANQTAADTGARLPHDPRARSTVVSGVQPAVGSGLCGDVCSGHGYGSVGVTTSAPAGSGLCGDVCSGHGYGSVGATTIALSVRPHPAASGGGFHWGDAGIGAGGAFALTIIGLGGVFVATNHRRRQPQHHQASASS
jgi:hypothetical protein